MIDITRPSRQRGFSLIEIAIVVTVLAIIASIAIPPAVNLLRSFRASADARNIAAQLALAKMRAANAFTQTRLNCDPTANSCQLEVCTSKGASACNTFSAEGGPVLLSQGSSFSFGSITTAAGSQTSIQNTNQIIFNSRSMPVDNTGAPTGNYALYLANQNGDYYAISVYATGRVAVWHYSNNAWVAQ